MQRRDRSVDGVRMAWEEAGDGVPLVLVHGIPTSPRLWRHVLPRVEGARCLAWEMVGYGGSIREGRGRDISVARQAEYLRAWLDAEGIEQAVFAGHDLGGGVVQILAVREPKRCLGLLLTNAIAYDSWPIPSVKAMQATAGLVEHLPTVAFRQVIRMFVRRGHDSAEQAEEALKEHWPYYQQQDGAAAFTRQVRSLDVKDTLAVANDLQRLDVAARIVWGVDDQFQKLHYGERLAKDLNAPLRRIEGGRHFTPEDHADVVADELNQLLTQLHTGGMAARG